MCGFGSQQQKEEKPSSPPMKEEDIDTTIAKLQSINKTFKKKSDVVIGKK